MRSQPYLFWYTGILSFSKHKENFILKNCENLWNLVDQRRMFLYFYIFAILTSNFSRHDLLCIALAESEARIYSMVYILK
jgi:hypothetical protein